MISAERLFSRVVIELRKLDQRRGAKFEYLGEDNETRLLLRALLTVMAQELAAVDYQITQLRDRLEKLEDE